MEMKLILEITKDKKLELTEAEAKTLYLKFDKLFGNKEWSYPYWRSNDIINYRTVDNTTITPTESEDYIRIRMY